MKIMHIVHSLNIGGLERVVIDLAGSFRDRGHEVAICCLSEKGSLSETAEARGVQVFAMGKKEGIDPLLPIRIGVFLKSHPFNVVHTHNESGLLYGASGAMLAGIRNIVHTDHGKEPEYDDHRIMKLVEGVLLKKVRHAVAVSGHLKEILAATAGIGSERFVTILNGIDTNRYSVHRPKGDMKKMIGLLPDSFVIGHVARLVPLKNQKFLLDLFAALKKKRKGLKLAIVGSGPLKSELEEHSGKMGLSEDVLFLDARMNIPEILSAFDLFVLTSLTEGISITLLEAMAAGVPVVASLAGGNPEIIKNGSSGLLIPLDFPSQWIREMEYLIEHEFERARLAWNAKQSVINQFSITAMSEKYGRLYDS